jgi:hypothetical protein
VVNPRAFLFGQLYTWEFGQKGHDLNVRVEGPLILNDIPMVLTAATEGVGLAHFDVFWVLAVVMPRLCPSCC